VADNELDDLQKKAGKLGFGLPDYMTADVYRCAAMLTR